MDSIAHSYLQDRNRLGQLAMKFRGTKCEEERQEIALDYARTVERLIQSELWNEAPPPEDQLPDVWMPRAFYAYWQGTLPESDVR